MPLSNIVNWVLKHGPTEISVSALIGLLLIGAVAAFAAWWLRGYFDDGQISGLKEKLDARDERLLLVRERQEELTRKLAEAMGTIAQLQRQIGVGETSKGLEKVRLAIQNATTANTALGSSLTTNQAPMFFYNPPSHPVVQQSTGFSTYRSPADTPEIKLAKKALDQKQSVA